MSRRRTAGYACLVLLGSMGFSFWRMLEANERLPTRTAGQATPPATRQESMDTAPSPPASAPLATPPPTPWPAAMPMATPAEVYASEEFRHVPAWVPRPAGAIAVGVQDATLRSDGLQEGVVQYTIALEAAATSAWLHESLTQHGMVAQADGRSWQSPAPRRFCRVSLASLDPGRTRFLLEYQALEHASGCACPTCHAPGGDSPALFPAIQ